MGNLSGDCLMATHFFSLIFHIYMKFQVATWKFQVEIIKIKNWKVEDSNQNDYEFTVWKDKKLMC